MPDSKPKTENNHERDANMKNDSVQIVNNNEKLWDVRDLTNMSMIKERFGRFCFLVFRSDNRHIS